MSVRTAYVGSQAVGDVLTSANFSKLPGGWIGDANSGSTDTTGVTTETDVTGASVTVTVNASRKLKITGYGVVQRSVADGMTHGYIKEGTTALGRWCQVWLPSTSAFDAQTGWCIVTPTAGSHTYKLTIERNSGTGSVGVFTGGGLTPARILVEDIGPAS